MISAGKTSLPCGTRIKIIKSDDSEILNLTGTVTHPFPGLMYPNTQYVIGIRLDEKYHGLFTRDILNLTPEDEFTPVFDDYNEKHGVYYLEGEHLLAERIGEGAYREIAQKWGFFDAQLGKFVFPSQETCGKCLKDIENNYAAILY